MSRISLSTVVLLAAFAFGSGTAAAQSLTPKSSTQSALTIKVTPRTVQGAVWEFDMVFDTHTQELNDDLLKSAVLVAPDGARLAPLAWQGDPPGGHHRKGFLRFNAPDPFPARIVLVVTRPGEPKARSFEWNAK